MENKEPLLKEKEERFPFLDEIPTEMPEKTEAEEENEKLPEPVIEEQSTVEEVKEEPTLPSTEEQSSVEETKEESTLLAQENPVVVMNKEPETEEKKDSNIPLIITVILSVLIGLFIYFKVVIPFYNGFKYYNLRFEDKTSEPVEENKNNNDNANEEEISLTSFKLTDTYSMIDITNTNELSNLYPIFYGNGVEMTSLTNNQKLSLILAYLNISCDMQSIGINDLSNAALKLFNDDSFIGSSSITSDDFTMNYDNNTMTFTIAMNKCPGANELSKTITRATQKDNNLYIYETINLNGDTKNFKWTYKKGNTNNYYFSSIIPL